MIHFHRWSQWSAPAVEVVSSWSGASYLGDHEMIVQNRVCEKCGAAGKRVVGIDR